MNVSGFNFLINQPLDKISEEQKQIFLLGDFNINLLNYNEHQPTNEFLDSLASNSIIPYILQPTRLTTHSKTLLIISFQMYFHVKQYLETLLQPYLIIFPNFCLLPMCFQILYAINQTSWKEIGQNLTNKTLFFITLIKIGLKFLNLISKNVNLSLDLYLDHMNVILDIHAPY